MPNPYPAKAVFCSTEKTVPLKMKKLLLLALIGSFSQVNLFAQTTNPAPYCPAGFAFIGGDTTGSDWINSVQLDSLDNVSDAVSPGLHYTFYNNVTVPNLVKGTNYSLKLNFYIGGGAGYAAWIDYNHDDVFDSSELISGITASTGIGLGASVPVTATVMIPATALSGNTRMRVRITEDDNYHGAYPGAYELACDSLNTTSYGGETEDYTVNIMTETKVNELSNKLQFTLYPNPANDVLTVKYTATGALTYAVYAVTGSKISEGTISNAKNTIDISGLERGLYFVRVVENGQQVGYEKFTKL